MRFWTTLGAQVKGRRSWRQVEFVYEVGGAVLPKEFDRTAFAVAMVDPTASELKSLGNALLADFDDHVVVALPAQWINEKSWKASRDASTECRNWKAREWVNKRRESIRMVKNGELVSVCTGCENILMRGAGACRPAHEHCTRELFDPAVDKITLPPMNLYMEPAKCITRFAFESYTLGNIGVTRSVDTPILPVQNRGSAFLGATKRYMTKLACPNCIFNEPRPDGSPRCVTHAHSRYCDGPYFDSDVPKNYGTDMRELIRLMGTPISKDRFLTAARKRGKGWITKTWRIDPELELGSLDHKHQLLDLQVLQTRNSKNNYDSARTEPEVWEDVRQEFDLSAEVQQPETLLERLLLLAYTKGTLSHARLGGGGWGGYGWSKLYGVCYDEKRDSANILFLLRNHKTSWHIRSVQDLGAHYSGFYSTIDNGERGAALVKILEERATNKNAVSECAAVIAKLADADVEVQAGRLRKMPSVDDLRG